ncbi:MAG: HlyC/CorC family transporter [Deltaproteobacteria bacterium]|nr:HlyC/CorC family transporter [Deltaproteobacteria bacterium]
MNWPKLIAWTFFCLAMEAFFSGSEIALVSADKSKLKQKAKEGERGAQIAMALARQPELFFSTTLLGQNFFIVANSILITFFIFDHYGVEYEWMGILLSPLVLLFGEALPKSVFQYAADRLTPLVSPIIFLFSYLFYPIVRPLSWLTLLLLGGVQGSLLKGSEVTAESLELLLQESEVQRELSPLFKKSLIKILSFAKKYTFEVMTPLADVFSLSDTTTVLEAIPHLREEGYSNIPVYKMRTPNIIGVVSFSHLLLAKNLQIPLGELMVPALRVSGSMGVKDLFLLLRDLKKNFAVVVDKNGATLGVVTLEDILEEVVGEIQDEYDKNEP